MNIDRHNYEEFFILYMDNELGSEDRRQVELFVEENPDLKEELMMLQQSRFVVDEEIKFDNKESLLRFASCDISVTNYEEWLLLYIDNELNPAQNTIVENFVMTHPAVKQELDLFRKTKLQREEAIIFPDKESLYRKEEKTRRVVMMRWTRIAAAAVLLIAVATISFFAFDTNGKATGPATGNNNPLASVDDSGNKTDSKPVVTVPAPKNERPTDQKPTIEVRNEVAIQTIPVSKKNDQKIEHKNTQNKVKENDPVVATTQDGNKNNLPDPVYNPKMNGKIDDKEKASFVGTTNDALTKLKEIDPAFAVTTSRPSALDNTVEVEGDNQSEKKNKLRGFFRKITRTLEKTTNIKATDDDDRLLIAGLAIKL
jgi:hypothetical protein